jgi:hypothetical protein
VGKLAVSYRTYANYGCQRAYVWLPTEKLTFPDAGSGRHNGYSNSSPYIFPDVPKETPPDIVFFIILGIVKLYASSTHELGGRSSVSVGSGLHGNTGFQVSLSPEGEADNRVIYAYSTLKESQPRAIARPDPSSVNFLRVALSRNLRLRQCCANSSTLVIVGCNACHSLRWAQLRSMMTFEIVIPSALYPELQADGESDNREPRITGGRLLSRL